MDYIFENMHIQAKFLQKGHSIPCKKLLSAALRMGRAPQRKGERVLALRVH